MKRTDMTMMRTLSLGIAVFLLAAVLAAAPPASIISVYGYDSNSNLSYICQAPQISPTLSTWAIGGKLSGVVVASGTATATFTAAPGLYLGALLSISGAAGLNGNYPVTGVSGLTVTFTTAAADGTYNAAGTKITTMNPLLSAYVWSIQKFTYVAGAIQTIYWVTSASSNGNYSTQPCTNALVY